MPLSSFCCENQYWNRKTLEDCLDCPHPCLSPGDLAFVWDWAIVKDADHPYHNDPNVVSVTQTLGCLRQAYYDRMHDYAEEPAKLLARCNGSALHAVRAQSWVGCGLASWQVEFVVEHDLGGGRKLMGSGDFRSAHTIRDYKFGTVSGGWQPRHAEQLAIYDAMLGGGNTLIVDQEALNKHRAHEVWHDGDALGQAVSRARELFAALDAEDPKMLVAEGPNVRMKYAKWCACDSCPHFERCGEGKKRKGE